MLNTFIKYLLIISDRNTCVSFSMSSPIENVMLTFPVQNCEHEDQFFLNVL